MITPPQDSPYFSAESKEVIGKFKGKNEKTAKCVRKYVIKKNITYESYKDCLLNGKQMLHSMRTIRSDHHQIGS